MKRLLWWMLFALVFIAAWRIAGVLMDLTLLGALIIILAFCRYWPRRTKQ